MDRLVGSSSKERSGAVEMLRTGRAGEAARLAGEGADGKVVAATLEEPDAARFLLHSSNMAFLSFLTSELSPPKLLRRLDLDESARAPKIGVLGPRERRARRDIFNLLLVAARVPVMLWEN